MFFFLQARWDKHVNKVSYLLTWRKRQGTEKSLAVVSVFKPRKNTPTPSFIVTTEIYESK